MLFRLFFTWAIAVVVAFDTYMSPAHEGQKAKRATHEANGKKAKEKIQKPEPQAKPAKRDSETLTVDLGGGVKLELVRVPAGEFLMGAASSDQDAKDDQKPQHPVKISHDFYMGKYEVTRGQFRRFVEDSGYVSEAERDKQGGHGYDPKTKKLGGRNPEFSWKKTGFAQTDEHPVVNVTWNDAVAFCEWLSRKAGRSCELPTEAEWEYACRAGTKTRYYNGDDPEGLVKIGNVADASFRKEFKDTPWALKGNDGHTFTAPVGKFQPNSFGVYDMLGNVWEWCADYYDENYYRETPPVDPKGPAKGDDRLLRGGSWYRVPTECTASYRHKGGPWGRIDAIGFRVAARLK